MHISAKLGTISEKELEECLFCFWVEAWTNGEATPKLCFSRTRRYPPPRIHRADRHYINLCQLMLSCYSVIVNWYSKLMRSTQQTLRHSQQILTDCSDGAWRGMKGESLQIQQNTGSAGGLQASFHIAWKLIQSPTQREEDTTVTSILQGTAFLYCDKHVFQWWYICSNWTSRYSF